MVDMIIYGSLSILIIILVRHVTQKKLPKSIFIVLWIAVICRLLLPFNLPAPINIYPAFSAVNEISEINIPVKAAPTVYENTTITDMVTVNVNSISNEANISAAKSGNIMVPVRILWISGIVVTLMIFLIPHLINVRRYKTALPVESEFIIQWKSHHLLKRNYAILYSDEIVTPFTYGIIKPVIILPNNIFDMDEATIDYILTHEYIHIKRCDILKKWIAMITVCVHWFNPLVWVMNSMMNNDIEIACDEKVIKSKGLDDKANYARILVDIASVKSRNNVLITNFNKNIIKQRITLIMRPAKASLRNIITCLVILSIVFMINITCYAVIQNDTIPGFVTSPRSLSTSECDSVDLDYFVVHESYGDYILLDVEMYTYESYYEEIYLPTLEKYKDYESTEEVYESYTYDGVTLTWNKDPVKNVEENLVAIQNHRLVLGKTVNGKSCAELGFPIRIDIINNGKEHYPSTIAGHYDENGYFRFYIHYPYKMGLGYGDENGETQIKVFTLNNEESINNEDLYLSEISKEYVPFLNELLEDELISQEFYDWQTRSPLERYLQMFFY